MGRGRKKSKAKSASSGSAGQEAIRLAGDWQPGWSPRTVLIGVAVIAAIVVLVVYLPVLSAQARALDDAQYLEDNPLITRPSVANAGRFFAEVLEPSTVEGYYQPLSMVSLMLDSALAGSVSDLRPFHRTALGLHLLNTVLVIVLLYLLFDQPLIAAVVGLLFGVHPLTVESVAWVSQRKTLLAMALALGCLIAYVRYARRRQPFIYGVALALFIAALLAKPTVTPLPFLLVLLDAWPLRCFSRRTVIEKVPFLVVAMVFAVITVVSQGRTAEISAPTYWAWWQIPLVVAYDLAFYLTKVFYPAGLTINYPVPAVMNLAQPLVIAGLSLIALRVLVGGLTLKKFKTVTVTGLWFLIALAPTMGLIGFTNVIVADRFVYFPGLALLMALAAGLNALWRRWSATGLLYRRLALLLVPVAFAAVWAAVAQQYLQLWKSTESLFTYAIAKAPHEPRLEAQLGFALGRQGRFADAVPHYQRALELSDGGDLNVLNNLAVAYVNLGQFEAALEACQRASQMAQTPAQQAMVQMNWGNALVAAKKYDLAIEHYRRVLEIQPDSVRVLTNLAVAYMEQGQLDAAKMQLAKAVKLDPLSAMAHYNLGLLHLRQGQPQAAIESLQRAVQLAPGNLAIQRDLAAAQAAAQGATIKNGG